jgi:(1->4)-alpha-D-glucan 1-alpha-D-glucosylmutase
VGYLHTLGVSDIYASPITEATPDSMHGYDVTDPHTINPEIGDIDDLRTLAHELRKKGMQWLQDIVPNHMAFHRMNFRLVDVLERGPDSPYYHYFDINWSHPSPALKGKIMVPFLGDREEKCLSRGEIKLAFSAAGFKVMYLDTPYPLSLSAYPLLSEQAKASGPGTTLPAIFTKMLAAARKVDLETWSNIREEFLTAMTEDEANTRFAEQVIARVNGDLAILKKLLDVQSYRLSYWKNTDTCINYRRFFTVNELICLRMEDEEVFDEYHAYLGKLLREKLIQGFRIDHIDGLYDPAKYTQRLRHLAGDSCYIIAEKILEAKEEMPGQWPLQGTSGYEFLSYMNQLLTFRKGARQLREFYHDLLPEMPPYEKLIMDSKRLILENYIRGEWENLTSLFESLQLSNGIPHERLREALGFFMLSLPVYRIYPDTLPLKGKSLLVVQEAFDKALKHGSDYSQEIDYLRDLFTNPQPGDDVRDAILAFLRRLMQFTGPLTAKGVEDTTFYIYNPLISHDEVGDSPAPLGMSVQRFHEKMVKRQADTHCSLNATATHDTKRGEDARVRINVLSRIPELWIEHVSQWLTINQPFRTIVDGRTVPELNDEYFIYQSILGGFPEDFAVTDEWIGRVQAYLNKALREAKVNTSWSEPDEQYERACEKFVAQILDTRHSFLESFVPFVKIVCDHAMVYSLSQTLLKLTAPGIPDVYQGCELWDLRFVDPDNRRPVDFDKRMELLFQIVLKEEKGTEAVFSYLQQHREDGIEKLYLMWRVLNFRKDHSQLFIHGAYVPLSLTGKEAAAVAFGRALGNMWTITAIPLGLAKHDMEEDDPFSSHFLVLPENAPAEWLNLLTGEIYSAPNQLSLADIFKRFPVAFLVSGE